MEKVLVKSDKYCGQYVAMKNVDDNRSEEHTSELQSH